MTNNVPDYTAIKIPDETPPEEFTPHERRADILRLIYAAGDPGAIKQARLANRYDVHESTVSRDMDRIRESHDEHLGREATFETEAEAKRTIKELRDQGRWFKAWKVREGLNEFLFDTGNLDREPDRAELDVRQRSSEVQYRVVREEPADLPEDEEGGGVDFEALGFAEGPVGIDVDAVEDVEGADE